MGNNHYRRKAEESKRMYYLGGREEKLATECVYLVKRTMYGAAWLVQQWSKNDMSHYRCAACGARYCDHACFMQGEHMLWCPHCKN